MKSRNIYNKMFIILAAIIIPLMITIGLAAWIMISEERIKPKYNPDSAFYVYLNKQETTYTGSPQLPSNPNITIDSSVTYKYRKVGETNYTNGAPTNAGEYYINFSSSKDKTEGGYPSSDVYFKINKATPTVSSWPTLSAIYWGNTPSFSSTGDTSNGSFSIVDGTLAFKSGESRTSAELPYTVSLLYTPNDTTNYNTLTSIANVKLKAVANVGSTFYATVDEAITSTTSGTIYVMLTEAGSDKAKTIGATTDTTTVTLASGVTLYVPYYMNTSTSPYTYNISLDTTSSDSTNLREFGELYYASAGNFADSTANSSYLKNYIIIDSDTTLSITSGATLQVTGIVGTTGTGTAGHTSRDYSEVKMISGSTIDNSGTIMLGGYIKEVTSSLAYTNNVANNPSNPYYSEVIIQSGATLKMPFIIHDYRGGTSTAGVYVNGSAIGAVGGNVDGYISPFNRYDMPNIQTRLTIIYGGSLIGYADLYTGALSLSFISVPAQHNTTEIAMIGSTSSYLLQVHSGTTVYCDCVTTTPGITTSTYNTRKTKLKIQGSNGATLNYLSMSITVGITINISTDNVLFPISDLYDIVLTGGGTFDISTKVKMMPGASLTVNNQSTLNINSEFIVYSDFNDKATIAPLYPTSAQLGKTGADLIVNGTLNINSGATFGGIVKTSASGGTLKVSTTSLTLTSLDGTGYRDSTDFLFKQSNSTTEKLRVHVYKNGVIDDNLTNLSQGTYYSIQGDDSEYGWYADNATIYYNANGGTLNGATSNGPYTTGETGYPIVLSSIDQTIPSRDHYTFAGWYLSAECKDSDALFTWNGTAFTKVKDYNMYVNTTLYAKWIPIEYTITYGNSYTFTGGSGSFSTNTNLTSFTYETANVLLTKPVHANGYVFEGWYYTSDNTKLTMLNGSELVNYLSSNNVNIYAKWYPAGTETFTVNYVNERNDEIPCLESQDLIIETESSWSNYSLPNIGYNNNVTDYQYYFDGWYTTETYNEGTLVTSLSEELFSSSSIVTLYAKWGVKCTVTLNWNGFKDENESYYITPNSTFTFPSHDDYTKSSTENDILTLYTLKWVNGENAYSCNSTSPIIVNNIEFKLTRVVNKQFTLLSIVNNNTSITFTTNSGYTMIKDTTTLTEISSHTSSSSSDSIYVQIGSNITCSFSYNKGYPSGYAIEVNGTETVRNEKGGTSYTISNITAVPYKVSASSGDWNGCVFSDAKILMADGTTKQVTEVKIGDLVTTWSFEEGKFVSRPVIFVEALKSVMVNKITLYFDDNTQVEIAYAQSFFDIDKLEYFSINADNVHEYVGVNIMTHNYGNVSSKQIVDYKVEIVMEDVYELITGYDFSFIFDDVLSMEPFLLYKLPFEITSELKYDEELMKEDIEKYGLYTYDEWSMYASEELFNLLNGKYFKVAISKGHFTIEYLLEIIERYLTEDNLT